MVPLCEEYVIVYKVPLPEALDPSWVIKTMDSWTILAEKRKSALCPYTNTFYIQFRRDGSFPTSFQAIAL